MTKKQVTPEKKPSGKKDKMTPAQIRFVYLYLGSENGECFNNATRAYGLAFDKNLEDIKQYNTSRAEGSKLLAKPSISAFKDKVLLELGYKPETIKKRYAQLANQNTNLPLALQANDRVAKIAGVLKDDPTKVNIPELEAVATAIRKILS